ncbi:hypothetical protein MKY48_31770 [Paenibacillus sp. FSL W8-0187]
MANEFEVDGQSYVLAGPELNDLNTYMVELGRPTTLICCRGTG